MSRDPQLLLNDILDSIDRIRSYTQGVDLEKFRRDDQAQDAVVRRFEVIGEAVKALPENLKNQRPEIRWGDIAGLRDVLIHGYHRVNPRRIWVVVKEDLDDLENAVRGLADEVERDDTD